MLYGNDTVLIDSVSFKSADFMNKLIKYNYPYFFDNLNINFFKTVVDVLPAEKHPVLFTDAPRVMDTVGAAFTIWYKDYFRLGIRIKIT